MVVRLEGDTVGKPLLQLGREVAVEDVAEKRLTRKKSTCANNRVECVQAVCGEMQR